MSSASALNEAFWIGWLLYAPPEARSPEREARFHPTRRWLADFLWRDELVVVEVEGGQWGGYVKCDRCGRYVTKASKSGRRYRVREAGGRHVRGAGFERDAEKYNALAGLGYARFAVTRAMLSPGRMQRTISMVSRCILARSGVRLEPSDSRTVYTTPTTTKAGG